MKKSLIVLFILRLFFYFSVIGLILIHQNIIVSFDSPGWIMWFVIIPVAALIAFLPEKTLKLHVRCIIALLGLLLLSIVAGGFGPGLLRPFFAGLISFTLTFLLFHYPRWAKLSILEPFFLAWVCLRLLALSRSSEDILGQDLVITQFIFVWTGVVFLLHSVVVYFCLYPSSSGGAGKEGLIFTLAALGALVLAIAVLPTDFVRNTVIKNLLPDRIPEMIGDSEKGIPEVGRRGEGRRTLPQGEGGRKPGLRGISEYDWPGQGGRAGEDLPGKGRGRGGRGGESVESRQYLVMVVASKQEPVYMGDVFRGQLDPVEGFLVSKEEPLNSLASQRLFATWFNNEWNYDQWRNRQEVFSLSTLPGNYLPYYPLEIDPTILSEDSGPLRYIHQVTANMHRGDPLELIYSAGRPLRATEKTNLAHYLEIPLEQGDLNVFGSWLDQALERWQVNGERYLKNIFPDKFLEESDPSNEFMQTIFAILVNFYNYQYNIDFGDSYSIATLREFLYDIKEGNCVEFSNSAALLGRIAGIPSRVVTGYLVAEDLQTEAHLQGLAALRDKIPVLRQFPFNDMYLVTDICKHSWVQFYIPDYGWIDFEPTTFAMPPMGSGNFNTWDVVIPLIDETKVFSPVRKIPWRAVIRVALVLATVALLAAYALRYGREIVLSFNTKRGGREGARSLYLLLLSKLAADGKPIKPASKTALEYAELFPGTNKDSPFATFAALYSELRWRKFNDSSEMEKRFIKLKQEYRSILKTTRRKGLLKALMRIISLRGLAYL
jgi:hypothetical protein